MRYNFVGTRNAKVVCSVGASVDADSIDEALEKLNDRDFKEFLVTNVDYLEDEFDNWNLIETDQDDDEPKRA